MNSKLTLWVISLLLPLSVATNARADDASMTLGATSATELSALFDHILPMFKAASNVTVHAVALESTDAGAIEKRGDTHALLLDDASIEDKIVADHYGLNPRMAMYRDFVIVGPSSDPAGIRGSTDAGKALAQIAAKGVRFASTGDGGAYRLELRLWKSAGIDTDRPSAWYRKVGPRAEDTLNAAATLGTYALVERASWAGFKDRKNLQILSGNDPALIDVYDSVLINPEKEPRNKSVYARIWHDWISDKHGFAAIASYRINDEQIFFACQGDAMELCRSAPRR